MKLLLWRNDKRFTEHKTSIFRNLVRETDPRVHIAPKWGRRIVCAVRTNVVHGKGRSADCDPSHFKSFLPTQPLRSTRTPSMLRRASSAVDGSRPKGAYPWRSPQIWHQNRPTKPVTFSEELTAESRPDPSVVLGLVHQSIQHVGDVGAQLLHVELVLDGWCRWHEEQGRRQPHEGTRRQLKRHCQFTRGQQTSLATVGVRRCHQIQWCHLKRWSRRRAVPFLKLRYLVKSVPFTSCSKYSSSSPDYVTRLWHADTGPLTRWRHRSSEVNQYHLSLTVRIRDQLRSLDTTRDHSRWRKVTRGHLRSLGVTLRHSGVTWGQPPNIRSLWVTKGQPPDVRSRGHSCATVRFQTLRTWPDHPGSGDLCQSRPGPVVSRRTCPQHWLRSGRDHTTPETSSERRGNWGRRTALGACGAMWAAAAVGGGSGGVAVVAAVF